MKKKILDTKTITTELCTSIDVLTMDKFIDCMVDNNLNKLLVSGMATKEALIGAWDKVFYAYCDALGDEEAGYILSLIRDIEIGISRVIHLRSSVAILKTMPSNVAMDYLREEGKDISDTPNEEELNLLESIISTDDEAGIQLLQEELKEVRAKKKTETPKRNHFLKVFAAISKEQGYTVRPKETTVREYCTYINIIQETIKHQDNHGTRPTD